jgi:hypothetical protein
MIFFDWRSNEWWSGDMGPDEVCDCDMCQKAYAQAAGYNYSELFEED